MPQPRSDTDGIEALLDRLVKAEGQDNDREGPGEDGQEAGGQEGRGQEDRRQGADGGPEDRHQEGGLIRPDTRIKLK
jgi:hypothetical protein